MNQLPGPSQMRRSRKKRKRTPSTTSDGQPESNEFERPRKRRRITIGKVDPFSPQTQRLMKFLRRRWNILIGKKLKESIKREEPLERETAFKEGLKKLYKIINFCLKVVASDGHGKDLYPFTELQFTAFMNQLPTFLPLIFGVTIYTTYTEQLHRLLGTIHKKLCFVWIGARRDGKSMETAIAMASLVLFCPSEPFSMAVMGMNGDCAKRMLGNIGQVLNWSVVESVVDGSLHNKINKETIYVTNPNDPKDKRQLTSHAPTLGQMKGTNKIFDCGDELTQWPWFFFPTQCAARYGESLGSVFITNPNPAEPRWDIFNQSSSVIEVLNRKRMCDKCIRKSKSNIGFDASLSLAMKKCWELGHVEPPDNFWVDQERVSGWSIYQSAEVQAAELNLGYFGSGLSQFSPDYIDKLFGRKTVLVDEFDCFSMGVDPCDYGSSKLGITIMGYRNAVFHVLFQCKQLVQDSTKIPELIFNAKVYFLNRAKKMGWLKPHGQYRNQTSQSNIKCVDWIESPGHKGNELQELYNTAGNYRTGDIATIYKTNKVMSALGWNRQTNQFDRLCIAKDKAKTEAYVWYMRYLIKHSKLRIHEKYFTNHPKGENYMLMEFKKEMMNFIRTKSRNGTSVGRLQARNKGSGGDDDLLVSAFMIPFNLKRTIDPVGFKLVKPTKIPRDEWILRNKDLNRQMFGRGWNQL